MKNCPNQINTSIDSEIFFHKKELTIHSVKDLCLYNGLPVFVDFYDYSHKNGWYIVDALKTRLIGVNREIPFKELFAEEFEPLDDGLDEISIYINIPELPVPLKKPVTTYDDLLASEKLYIRLNSQDNDIRDHYNGWYHHNEDHSCLINDMGLTLPYEGLLYAYQAFIIEPLI